MRIASVAHAIKDLIVIGGGSGGLATAKEAASLGASVTLFDFVRPSPKGTTWGLGGTCVNVGCVPKKLLHHVSQIGDIARTECPAWGWDISFRSKVINWDTVTRTTQNYIRSLNFNYRKQLRSQSVEYISGSARMVGESSVEYIQGGEKKILEGKNVVIATGSRPVVTGIEGVEFCVTSDDIFSLKEPPGKTLVIGGSYVALETAGFLVGLGVVLAIRSKALKTFDQQCVSLLISDLRRRGVRVNEGLSVNKIESVTPDRTLVHFNEKCNSEEFKTVVLAIGREAETTQLNLEKLGSHLDTFGFIKTDECDALLNSNKMFAIGDVCGRFELTPVAVKAGTLLARRLFSGSNTRMGYQAIPTTVFTPTEYGCVGLSQEQAEYTYGQDNIEIYLQEFDSLESSPLEAIAGQHCLAKLVCLRNSTQRILGVHFVGPHAAEVVQGLALAVALNVSKKKLDSLVGIHPSNAEVFTQLEITQRSGKEFRISGGCGGGRCG